MFKYLILFVSSFLITILELFLSEIIFTPVITLVGLMVILVWTDKVGKYTELEKWIFTLLMSLVYGILFQQNLGIILFPLAVSVLLLKLFLSKLKILDWEIWLSLGFFNFWVVGLWISGVRFSFLETVIAIIINFILFLIIQTLLNRWITQETVYLRK